MMLQLTLISAVLLAQQASPDNPIDTAKAARYFQEAKWLYADEGGRLWGKSLEAPLLFVDPKTGFAVASQADTGGQLKAQDGVYVGQVPKNFGVANTSSEWSGVKWSMLRWPVPSKPLDRMQMIAHESWHRLQPDLGLPGTMSQNAHLDTLNGRIWLQMEYRALAKALTSEGGDRLQAIKDALVFRAYRQSLFPEAKAHEDRMEVHEGMAEYTGISCQGQNPYDARGYLAHRMPASAQKPTFAFSFAYETGPAYGLLLDEDSPKWRVGLSPASSVADMLTAALKIQLPSNLKDTAKGRASAYDGATLISKETEMFRKHEAEERAFIKNFVEGPVLELPLANMKFTYDPNTVFALGENGNIYRQTKVSDAWGVIEVADAGLRMGKNFNVVFVPAPASPTQLKTSGWTLTLNPGWKLVPGKRKGDYIVVKE